MYVINPLDGLPEVCFQVLENFVNDLAKCGDALVSLDVLHYLVCNEKHPESDAIGPIYDISNDPLAVRIKHCVICSGVCHLSVLVATV